MLSFMGCFFVVEVTSVEERAIGWDTRAGLDVGGGPDFFRLRFWNAAIAAAWLSVEFSDISWRMLLG